MFDDKNEFADKITHQAFLALHDASAAILVCDGKTGITELDKEISRWLRKNTKVPIYLAVNKCESLTKGELQSQVFWELGMGNPYPISGIHGIGFNDIMDVITTSHMKKHIKVLKENATNIALIGRPNVGKSSLFNRLDFI